MFNSMYYDGRGLGQVVCDDAGCYDTGDTGSTSVYGSGAGQEPATGYGNNPFPLPSGTPTSSPSNLPGVISSIGNVFASIFKTIQPLPQGCTQVAGPYGTSTQCLATNQSSSLNLSSFGSSLGGTSLLPILLIGGAILLFSRGK